ncbi:MAG: hypothetical protein QOJ85_3682, partial [Solirubrobacteraceae bacterium]|nr:hypothetical protein [Solirubrobacteraceae bacterium]
EDSLRPVAELAREASELLGPAARELGCATELAGLADLMQDGGGAGVQRAACRDGDIASVIEALVDLTAARAGHPTAGG